MPEKNQSKKITLIILLLAIIAGVVLFFLFKPKPATVKPVQIPVEKTIPTMGNKNAKIHIIAFEDLKCNNCKRYNESLFPQVKKALIDTGKAKYSVVLLAFIPGSIPAANAAYCLYHQNPKYFFPFVKYVYKHQMAENKDWATVSRLLQYASSAVPSANMDQLSNCIVNVQYQQKVEANLKLAEKVMGGTVATPSIYINGRKLKDFTMSGVNKLAK